MAEARKNSRAARGLGRGLDSMIPTDVLNGIVADDNASSANSGKADGGSENTAPKSDTMLKITEIEPNREQPRKIFDDEKTLELADSIKKLGLIQPIIVTKRDDYYMIVAGERRWRASKIAGLKEVPVIIKELSDEQIAMIALVENLQREDLNPIEEAMAYKQLISKFGWTQDEVAERVSKSRSAITNALRLLKLAPEVQKLVTDGKLSNGHARALIPVDDVEQQIRLAEQIVAEELSVRDVEKLIKSLGKTQTKRKKEKPTDAQLAAIYASLEEKMKGALGTKVTIIPKENGAGKLELEFYSHDDLERIIQKLM